MADTHHTARAFGKIRRLESGKLQASYVVNGKRYFAPHTFSDPVRGSGGEKAATKAKRWLREQQVAIEHGTWKAPDVVAEATAAAAKAEKKAKAEAAARMIPFGEFADQWLAKRYTRGGKPLRATTISEYRRLLAGPLADFAAIPVPSITPGMVKDWHAAQLATGKVTQTSRAYSLLGSIMKDAVDRDLITHSPCTIRGAASATSEKEVKPPTEAELAIILGALAEPYRSMVNTLAWSGLRFGELSELRGRDVEVDGDQVILHVTRGVTHVPGKGAIVGPPKTKNGTRDVLLPAFVNADVLGRLRGSDDLLWHAAGDPTKHLRASTVAKAWNPARELAGRPDMPIHALRHHSVSRYSEAGATEAEVLERHGQASSAMARKYAHGLGRESDLVAKLAGPRAAVDA